MHEDISRGKRPHIPNGSYNDDCSSPLEKRERRHLYKRQRPETQSAQAHELSGESQFLGEPSQRRHY